MGFIFLLKSCFDGGLPENKSTVSGLNIDSISASLDKYYVIEKSDNDATNIRLFLYVSDTSKINSINQFLIDKYNNNKSKYLDIYYFNKKGIGQTYLYKQMSESVSEKEKDKLFQHFMAVYKFNPSNSFEKLEFERHKK